MLCEEVELFEQLNLSESTKYDDPKDFYTFMLDKIYAYMLNRNFSNNISLREKNHILRLIKLKFNRSHIKNLIMTKPYNASDYRLVTNFMNVLAYRGVGILQTQTQNLKIFPSKEELDNINQYSKDYNSTIDVKPDCKGSGDIDVTKNCQKKNKRGKNPLIDSLLITSKKTKKVEEVKVVNLYSCDMDNENFVTREDLNYFIETFNKLLFNTYPHIKNLISYLKNIASIFNDLNLPII